MKSKKYIVLLSFCLLLGLMVLSQETETVDPNQQSPQSETLPNSQADPSAPTSPNKSNQPQNTQSSKPLQPLQIRSTVRAHGNIDMPQGI